ncbi:Sin3 associated polypeptide p18-domain-containing protein [Phycomyces nitens]|nr:Sin3 associated polypeptide p18-domain-containing protein [Phycomyces nitens]
MSTPIDREKECPFLLRVFTKQGAHHRLNEFTVENTPSADELQLYTWRNATLDELAQLIQQVIPEAQHHDARISFRLVYLDSARATFLYRDLGRILTSKPSPDQTKTLEDCNFFIGDYLDVAIFIGPPPVRQDARPGREGRFNRNPRFGGPRGNDREPREQRFGRDRDTRDSRPAFGNNRRGDRF